MARNGCVAYRVCAGCGKPLWTLCTRLVAAAAARPRASRRSASIAVQRSRYPARPCAPSAAPRSRRPLGRITCAVAACSAHGLSVARAPVQSTMRPTASRTLSSLYCNGTSTGATSRWCGRLRNSCRIGRHCRWVTTTSSYRFLCISAACAGVASTSHSSWCVPWLAGLAFESTRFRCSAPAPPLRRCTSAIANASTTSATPSR